MKRAIMGDAPLFPPNVMYPDEQYEKIAKIGEYFSYFKILSKIYFLKF